MATEELRQLTREIFARGLSRRQFAQLSGALVATGSLTALLAACGGDDDDDATTSTSTSGGTTPTAGTSAASATTSGGTSGSPAATSAGGGASPTSLLPTATAASGINQPTASTGEAKYGGILKAAMQVDVTHLDPHFIDSYSSSLVTEEIYEGLVQFDPDMNVQPSLATSYDISEDGLTYTFKLKKGVKFHNGREFVVDDVVYSINRVSDPKGGSTQQYLLASVQSTTAADADTAVITLSSPFAPLIIELPAIVIVPQEVVKEKGDLKTTAVGTGPFKFVEFIPNSHAKLERNDDYHVEGVPYLDGIEWQPIPDDPTRTANIKTGSVDFADQVPQKDIDSLGTEKGVVLVSGPGTLNDYLILNVTKKPFDDVRVRQAIAWTIDRQAMTDTILFGHGRPIDGGIIPDWSWAYSDLHVYTQPDIDKAKQLMADAGYADGFDMTIGAGASYNAQVQAAEVLKDQLKQININVTPKPEEWTTYISQTINPKNFDAAIIGWIGAIDPDDVLYPRFSTHGSFDESSYNNPQVDDLLDQGRTLQTHDERKPVYNQAEAMVVDEAPEVFFYFYDQYEALRDYVKGYKHMANTSKLTFKYVWLDK